MSEHKIRKSQSIDYESTYDLFEKVSTHMTENEIHQWDYEYPTRDIIKKDIDSDSHFVIEDDGVIIGTIVLDASQDEQYKTVHWKTRDVDILVIHRLGVHPDYQGQGIGYQLCKFAEEYATSNGYKSIRLDAYAGNPASNHLYQKLGYKRANGFCYFRKKAIPFYCYEKGFV